MPIKIIKETFEYCAENKPFFVFLMILLFICNFLMDLTDSTIVIPFIISLLMFGYGLQVTQNIIGGGTTLPKILPKKVLIYGVKGYLVGLFYLLIQSAALVAVAQCLHFPPFEMEEFILNYDESLHLLLNHDLISGAIFVISGILIVYVTTFFMELAIARLADGGRLKEAFNFSKIKRAIDIIGWRNYFKDYTKLVFSIIFLSFLIQIQIPIDILETIADTFFNFLIFAIEFVCVGHIYKVYIDKKSEIQTSN